MRWGLVKVATFNINNINKQLDNLLSWIGKAEPEVTPPCRTKCDPGGAPSEVETG